MTPIPCAKLSPPKGRFYRDCGARIFPPRTGVSKWRQTLRWVSKPKHDPAVLKDELLQVFGSAVLDDAKSRLIIPSFEGLYGEPFIYKTPHHPDYQNDRHKKFAHVALHTTAAPSYFPAVADDRYIMIDGESWARESGQVDKWIFCLTTARLAEDQEIR
jgi:uncharacterized protein